MTIDTDRADDGTAWIRINRPDHLNAFTPEMYRDLRDAVRAADRDDTIDVLVITGVGRAFATGGDLDAVHKAITGDDPLAIYEFEDSFPFDAIRDCDKVTIAAINGYCFGSGIVISGLCDLVVASEDATFSVPEGLVGIADPLVPTALFTKIPTTQLKFLALTAERISAEEASRLGLVTRVAGTAGLEQSVQEIVDAVRRTTPTARRYYKQFINSLLPRPNIKEMYRPLLSPEGRAAITAFAQRRRNP